MFKSFYLIILIVSTRQFSTSPLEFATVVEKTQANHLEKPTSLLGDIPHIDVNSNSEEWTHLKAKYQDVGKNGRRHFYFDFNETLWNKEPNELPDVRRSLEALVADERNQVFIITMRPLGKMREIMLPEFPKELLEKIYIGPEGGIQVGRMHEEPIIKPEYEPLDQKVIYEKVFQLFENAGYDPNKIKFTPGTYGFSFYLKPLNREGSEFDEIEGALRGILQEEKAYQHFELRRSLEGMVWTIAPKGHDKGIRVRKLIEERQPEFALSMGDSDADEKMHKVLKDKGQFSIVVNTDKKMETLANYQVNNPKEARQLILYLSSYS